MEYFTPEIEDIRVGYECETQVDPYPNWVPTIIEKDGNEFEYIFDRTWTVRVPYLTKEQIEKEGWKHVWFEGDVHSYEKDELVLSTFEGVQRVKINYKTGYQLFDGECKDINTFRYICKLLKI